MNFDERIKLENAIRKKRVKVCFPVINRGELWYRRLTNEQYGELTEWYEKWLDAPQTLVVPDNLPWLNDKLKELEDY